MHTATLRPYRERIGTLFSWGERYQRVGEQVLERLRAGGRRVVAVHLRRGDYGYDAFFRAPCTWYERWVRSEGLDPERHVIFLCSEEAARYAHRFPGYTVASSSLFAGELGVEEWLLDFLLLCSSDVLAISNSTFSFFASLLNNNATCFARPVAETEGLVKFDPWDAHPLLGTKLSRETHLRLAEQD
jgi:hypothetical protein